MNVSVVIPAFNEKDAIGSTVDAVLKILEKSGAKETEIIVVDDGSTDGTGDIAREHGARVIRNLQNQGYGRSLKNGIAAARYDTIVIPDADGTYPVNRIPDLLAIYSQGYHMVVAARTGKHYRESIFKMPLRRILKWLVEFTAGRDVPDINSGLRVFGKNTVKKFVPRLCDTFSFTTSLTLAYMMNSLYVEYLPIEYYARVGKTKVRLLKDSLRTLQYIVQAILYYDPLKIFLVMSGASILFSIACFAMTLMFGLTSTFLLGVGGILLAILIFAIGLLADLLAQIMHHSTG